MKTLVIAICLCVASVANLAAGVTVLRVHMVAGAGDAWPTREIEVVVSPAAKKPLLDEIGEGIRRWNDAGLPITFKPTGNPKNPGYILITPTGVAPCVKEPTSLVDSSKIEKARGYTRGGVGFKTFRRYDVCLNPTTATHGTVLHEFGHVVGLYHEQTHCDSFLYTLKTLWGKDGTNEPFKFDCKSGEAPPKDPNTESPITSTNSLAQMASTYDFASIMQYPIRLSNGQFGLTALGVLELDRIKLKPEQVGARPSLTDKDRSILSEKDKQSLKFLYH